MGAPVNSDPRIRVAALMLWRDQVVLVRHRKEGREYHLLPGGGVELGETLCVALKREVFEETGIVCAPVELAFVHDSIAPDVSRHVVNIVFAANIDKFPHTHTSLDDRIVGVDLVDPQSMTQLDLRPPIALDLIALLQDASDLRPRYTGSKYI